MLSDTDSGAAGQTALPGLQNGQTDREGRELRVTARFLQSGSRAACFYLLCLSPKTDRETDFTVPFYRWGNAGPQG